MTVKELKQWLSKYDEGAEVQFTYQYGDHWRTNVSPSITGLQERDVVFSAYHRMDRLVEIDEDQGEVESEHIRTVVVIHGK